MKKQIFIAILIVVAIVAALGAVKWPQIVKLMSAGKTYAPPPDTVSSAVAHEEKWQQTLTAVGTINPQNGVTLASEVAGTVAEITVADGTTVAKGDLLLRLDTSSEEAQLSSAETQTELSRLNAERTRSLRAGNTVSQAELDQAEATLKQNQANADVIRAAIKKKTIRAPFAGRLGIWQVNVGASLDARRALISLQSLTPVYADFSLPQQDLSQLKTGQAVQLTCDAYINQTFDGVLTAINPDLDAATRSVPLRATFENTDQLLRPGMFVRVTVLLPEARPVLTVPATAVLSLAGTSEAVFVIEPSTNAAGGLVVRQQIVRTGPRQGNSVTVLSGLKAGDKVVSAGLFKLRNGSPVTVNNDIVPPTVKNPSDS